MRICFTLKQAMISNLKKSREWADEVYAKCMPQPHSLSISKCLIPNLSYLFFEQHPKFDVPANVSIAIFFDRQNDIGSIPLHVRPTRLNDEIFKGSTAEHTLEVAKPFEPALEARCFQ